MRPEEQAAACHGVVKIYWSATGEVHALKGIDATFPAGTVTALVGPSGSGKSSLLRILACIDRPTAGQVLVGRVEVSSLGARRRRAARRAAIGYLFQRPSDNLVPYLTALQQVELAAGLRGHRDRSEAESLLETLGMRARQDHHPWQLSGGEQQRVALAAAVIGKPELVVADEPTAELDSGSGQDLMEILGGLASAGATFVVATHDPIVMRASDRILSLRHGALEAETTANRQLSVIDAFGRIQLPPGALPMFPERRAEIRVEDGEVRIKPP